MELFLKARYGILFILIALTSIVIHWPIVFTNNPIDIDYNIVISPLENIHSWQQFKKVQVKLFDIQPVRDILLLGQAWIKSKIHFQVYTFFNWLLAVSMAFILRKTLIRFKIDEKLSLLAASLFLFHPILSWVIYWPSAQKHLLSSFFISVSAYYCIKKIQDETTNYDFFIWLFYFLSIFSQPITIFAIIPYFAIFYKHLKFKEELVVSSLLVLSFLICLVLNAYYYSEIYPIQTKVFKVSDFDLGMNLANSIVSFSRSFTQIFLPIHFSINYVKVSILSFLGLPIFILSSIWIYHQSGKNIFFQYLVVSLFPLISVYSRITNIFISDTYLIWTTLSIIGFLITTLSISFKKTTVPFSLLLILVIGKSTYESRITGSHIKYFQSSFQREPGCKTAAQYLSYLMKEKYLNTLEFNKVMEDFLKNKCHITGAGTNISITNFLSIYFFISDKLSDQQKIHNLEILPIRTIVSDTILLMLYEKSGKSENADKVLKRLNSRNAMEKSIQFRSNFIQTLNFP